MFGDGQKMYRGTCAPNPWPACLAPIHYSPVSEGMITPQGVLDRERQAWHALSTQLEEHTTPPSLMQLLTPAVPDPVCLYAWDAGP